MHVWSVGNNVRSQLGRNMFNSGLGTKPSLIPALEGRPISFIDAGEYHAAAVTTLGELLMWGFNEEHQCSDGERVLELPTLITSLQDRHTEKVACGGHHTLVLTSNGEAIFFGNCDVVHPELRNGTRSGSGVSPTIIKSAVIDIACGWNHSALITKDGRLFTFGSNTFGKLGIPSKRQNVAMPDTINPDYPVEVDLFSKLKIAVVQVSLGISFTLALTKGGHVYSFGDCQHGQLGLGHYLSSYTPRRIEALASHAIVKLAPCKGYHCAALTSTGELYTWGKNTCGELGDGTTKTSPTPILLTQLVEAKQKIVDVSCGFNFTVAVTNQGIPLVWGSMNKLLGDKAQNVLSPQPLLGPTSITRVSAGSDFLLLLQGSPTFQLRLDFSKHVNSDTFADCMIQTKDGALKGHRVLLSRSRAWGSLLQQFKQDAVLPLHSDSTQDVLSWLQLMYSLTSQSDPEHQEIFSLLNQGRNLQVQDSLKLHMSGFVNNPLYSDIVFIIENKPFYAHKIVLVSRSTFFERMFISQFREQQENEITIPEARFSTWHHLMFYLYTNEISENCDPNEALDLLALTEQYGLSHLKVICETLVASHLDTESVVYVYMMAKTYAAPSLQSCCMKFMREYANQVRNVPLFQNLSQPEQKEILYG